MGELFVLEFHVNFFVEISYIKSKVTQDHSETINLLSMWNNANDQHIHINIIFRIICFDYSTKRFSFSSSFCYIFLFSGIYWRAISYFRAFYSLKPARKEIRNNLFYKIRERAQATYIILQWECFLPVKRFHDEIELRVKLNLPSGHHSGSISFFPSLNSTQLKLANSLLFMKTPSHILPCIFSYCF